MADGEAGKAGAVLSAERLEAVKAQYPAIADALLDHEDAAYDCGDWCDFDAEPYAALDDRCDTAECGVWAAILDALSQPERERDLLGETARRLTAELDAAVAERDRHWEALDLALRRLREPITLADARQARQFLTQYANAVQKDRVLAARAAAAGIAE